jgi:hypothetical protein
MRPVLVPGEMKQQHRAAQVRLWGLIAILVYWSSIVWLPNAFKLMGIAPNNIPRALVRMLEVYYWPPMRVLGLLTHVLPYPEFMFYGPYVAVGLPAAVCSALWWLATRRYVRRSVPA